MKKRILTIQIQIENQELANWIWDSHMDLQCIHGVSVQAIHEGEIPEVIDSSEET